MRIGAEAAAQLLVGQRRALALQVVEQPRHVVEVERADVDAVDLEKDPIEVPDPATTPVPDELRAEIEAHLAKYPDPRSAALPALAAAQRHHGWCSPEAIAQAATVMRLTPAYLSAVATFYDMFHTEPVGLHRVYVCTNISCSLNGGRELFDAIQAHESQVEGLVEVFGDRMRELMAEETFRLAAVKGA